MRSKKIFVSICLLFGSSYTTLTACGGNDVFSGSNSVSNGDGDGDGGANNIVNGINCDATLTPAENACVVDESLGVFVSSNAAAASADGTRGHPFATMQAGLVAAKSQKKRVYACIGNYNEQVTLIDGVSMFGDLDCNQNWTVVPVHANITAPASPAVRADQIQSPTRIDSIDMTAPLGNAATPSSIAVLVTSSPGLTIANATILARNGFNGTDGTPATQLVQTGSLSGTSLPATSRCSSSTGTILGVCLLNSTDGATSICSLPDGGVADDGGYNGGQGGTGGTGGGCGDSMFQAGAFVCTSIAHQAGAGGAPPGGNPGQAGADGVSGSDADGGVISVTGFAAGNGTAGTSGGPGAGGSGGMGGAVPSTEGEAAGGLSGGGGGCPGLAGTAGTGGGASIAIISSDSASTFDTCNIQSSNGGDAGKGTLGSAPTIGGNGAGSGGDPGWSGNGSAGPSYGVASHGAALILKNTKPLAGSGGHGVAAQTAGAETIPATPDGASAATTTF